MTRPEVRTLEAPGLEGVPAMGMPAMDFRSKTPGPRRYPGGSGILPPRAVSENLPARDGQYLQGSMDGARAKGVTFRLGVAVGEKA